MNGILNIIPLLQHSEKNCGDIVYHIVRYEIMMSGLEAGFNGVLKFWHGPHICSHSLSDASLTMLPHHSNHQHFWEQRYDAKGLIND